MRLIDFKIGQAVRYWNKVEIRSFQGFLPTNRAHDHKANARRIQPFFLRERINNPFRCFDQGCRAIRRTV